MAQAAMRLTVAVLFLLSSCSPKATNSGQASTAPTNAAAPQQAAAEKYTDQQLEALLAPIALYPDSACSRRC